MPSTSALRDFNSWLNAGQARDQSDDAAPSPSDDPLQDQGDDQGQTLDQAQIQTTQDLTATNQAQALSNPAAGPTDPSPEAIAGTAQGDPAPVVLADNYPLPEHKDDVVGQNKVVDPKDKMPGYGGIQGTLPEPGKPGRITGVVVDPPDVGPLKPSGDPAQYSWGDKDATGGRGSPPDRGPGWKWDSEGLQWVPWPCPGEGYKWDKSSQDWRYVPAPGEGYSWDSTIHDWVYKGPTSNLGKRLHESVDALQSQLKSIQAKALEDS